MKKRLNIDITSWEIWSLTFTALRVPSLSGIMEKQKHGRDRPAKGWAGAGWAAHRGSPHSEFMCKLQHVQKYCHSKHHVESYHIIV